MCEFFQRELDRERGELRDRERESDEENRETESGRGKFEKEEKRLSI